MAKNLLIVESPAKMKTIKKFLGSDYTVAASMGHVRDLPRSSMGVDIEHDYEPKYITIRGKGELLSALRKEVKKADRIYLATDPDREGEAISWHLKTALNLDNAPDKKVARITFNEITKSAVRNALKNPRELNMDLIDAQQARRVTDRMLGYSISPILWDKVKRGLSAGRVQSVALNLICRRDEEISSFVPVEYWTVDGIIKKGSKQILFSYYGEDGKKNPLNSGEEAEKILAAVKGTELKVDKIRTAERLRTQPLPYTTSTLQQDASRMLNMSPQKTMRIAQKLYEGVNVKGKGSIGLITYLRTDSVHISDEAFEAGCRYIRAHYGDAYASGKKPASKKTLNVQDAHEAIRPTDIDITPAELKTQLERDEYRLYQLIWQRYTASLMSPAVYSVTSAVLTAGSHEFRANGSRLLFEGFRAVYKNTDEEEKQQDLSFLKEGESISFHQVDAEQHFTEPPAHYTEASLVHELEEEGIGRPSTYAPTITTLLGRRYVSKEKKSLYATELGQAVNDIMEKSFPDIVDTGFTADMESRLDEIAEGKLDWKQVISDFYPRLEKEVEDAKANAEKVKVADQVSDVPCDRCGRMMVIKYGPHGKFLACPGFPECRNTMPYVERTGVSCPKCGADIIRRRSKKGRVFYSCENRDCDFISWRMPSNKGEEAAG